MAAKFSLARIAAIFVEVCKISNHSFVRKRVQSEHSYCSAVDRVKHLISFAR